MQCVMGWVGLGGDDVSRGIGSAGRPRTGGRARKDRTVGLSVVHFGRCGYDIRPQSWRTQSACHVPSRSMEALKDCIAPSREEAESDVRSARGRGRASIGHASTWRSGAAKGEWSVVSVSVGLAMRYSTASRRCDTSREPEESAMARRSFSEGMVWRRAAAYACALLNAAT